MDTIKSHLRIDPVDEVRKITQLISRKFQQLNRKTALVGLSGGLDSSLAAVLTAKSLGTENLVCYYLPIRGSKPLHRKHAHLLADEFRLHLETIRITPVLRSLKIYSLLPLDIFLTRGLRNWAVEYGKKRFLTASKGEFLNMCLSGTGGS